jgi:pyruvate dehydrogenase E2 component (dihydrolipoamide acetyltransferase)
VQVGQQIDADTIIADIETDKAVMEVPAGIQGTVLALLADVGADVPVRKPIAVVGEPGESVTDIPAVATQPAVDTVLKPLPVANSTSATLQLAQPVTGVTASPRAKTLAAQNGVSIGQLTGSGPGGRIIERDVQAAFASSACLIRSTGGIGWRPAGQSGSGLGGRLTDKEATITVQPGHQSMPTDYPGNYTDTNLVGIRKIIATRMLESLATSAQCSYHISAPAAGLRRLRAIFKVSDPALGLSQVTIGDLVGFALVKTLLRHLALNSTLDGDAWRVFDQVHLAIAVDTPRGLIVPVLRSASAMDLRQFAAASKKLVIGATSGEISPDLLAGGTFTVSNLGSFGVESFTPIINQPQVAILGVSTISAHTVAKADDTISVEQHIGLSLTANHQVIDGADAARFLQDLCQAIADIELTVLS